MVDALENQGCTLMIASENILCTKIKIKYNLIIYVDKIIGTVRNKLRDPRWQDLQHELNAHISEDSGMCVPHGSLLPRLLVFLTCIVHQYTVLVTCVLISTIIEHTGISEFHHHPSNIVIP